MNEGKNKDCLKKLFDYLSHPQGGDCNNSDNDGYGDDDSFYITRE